MSKSDDLIGPTYFEVKPEVAAPLPEPTDHVLETYPAPVSIEQHKFIMCKSPSCENDKPHCAWAWCGSPRNHPSHFSVAKPKIFVFLNAHNANGDELPLAIAEDGRFLASHVCSPGRSRHFMGFDGSTFQHAEYDSHYRSGWELEWIDDFKNHEGLQAALARYVSIYTNDAED